MADGLDARVLAQSAWILRRATIRIDRIPVFAESLELRTWCSGVAKSVAERSTTISGDRGAAVEVETIWVHVDPVARRPTRLPPEFHAVYGASAAGNRPRSSLRHPATPPDDSHAFDWTFTRADIDIAGHVNNTVYWRIAEEYLDGAAPGAEAVALVAEYRSGIGAGPARVHRAGGMLWVSDSSGAVVATLSAEPY